MRLKIISYGKNRQDILIVDAETGQQLEGVQSIDWHADIDNNAYVVMKVLKPEIYLETDNIRINKV